VAGNTALEESICSKYDFSKVEDLRLFVNGTFYNEESLVTAATGMTSAMLSTFYNPAVTTSFGYYLNDIQA
jgi:hypothetical protein